MPDYTSLLSLLARRDFLRHAGLGFLSCGLNSHNSLGNAFAQRPLKPGICRNTPSGGPYLPREPGVGLGTPKALFDDQFLWNEGQRLVIRLLGEEDDDWHRLLGTQCAILRQHGQIMRISRCVLSMRVMRVQKISRLISIRTRARMAADIRITASTGVGSAFNRAIIANVRQACVFCSIPPWPANPRKAAREEVGR